MKQTLLAAAALIARPVRGCMPSSAAKCFSGAVRMQSDLTAAFDLVADKTNWKNPIDAFISIFEDEALISDAVIHFTGSAPTITRASHLLSRVVADGYYLTMRGIAISAEAYRAIKASLPRGASLKPAQPLAGGFRMWLPVTALAEIDAARLRGETRSAAIIRLAHLT
jgi:hypothetical protein